MTAETVIANIKELSMDEQQKVADFVVAELIVDDSDMEKEADKEAAHRNQDIEGGLTPVLNHEEVFRGVRAQISS